MNILGAALAIGTLLAVAAPGSSAAQGSTRLSQLREPDHGKVIDVPVGQSVEIHLAENRTTGFRWHVAPATPACTVIHDEGAVAPTSVAPGAGGEHRWRLEAKTPGECDVEFHYRRGWERNAPPARTFRVHVRVTR